MIGGIVLCGGKSSRMGRPKATLPFGPELMLPRVLRLLSQVVSPLVVVAAQGQELPHLPGETILVRDEREGLGPLEGLRVGLSALPSDCEAAYASSCDVPLLSTAFVRRLVEIYHEQRSSIEIVVPFAEGFHHPLASIYSVGVIAAIEALLAANRRRPLFLFEQMRTRVVGEEELRCIDPELHSLRNLNHEADYRAALAIAGYGGTL